MMHIREYQCHQRDFDPASGRVLDGVRTEKIVSGHQLLLHQAFRPKKGISLEI